MTVAARRRAEGRFSVLPKFFDRSARRWPTAIAVDVPPGVGRGHRKEITYAKLKRQSDRLARIICTAVGERAVVAIFLPRTTEQLYVGQLGVLKSGHTYVCLDPMFPDEQLRHILQDSDPGVLLTDAEGRDRATRIGYSGRVIRLDRPLEALTTPLPPPPRPEDVAYIIYTSGTTGQPKGVMIAHHSISNLINSDISEFDLDPHDRVAQGSSAAYDSSIEEAWMALSSGATIVVMDDDTARLGPDLVQWLRNERITVLCPPPTLLRATGADDPQTELPDLRLLYVGGEALPEDVAHRWAQGRRMVNGYGPTECTVTCLRWEVSPGEEIAIGRPVSGLQAWVLDENLEPVADGDKGELCMGGTGLAVGYRNQSTLTETKFPEHPSLGRIYRTGDLVHADAAGTIFYHGRIDSQVKLRGYRVELEAIETCMARCDGVREAACRIQGDGSAQALAAHVVASDPDCPPGLDELKRQLHDSLPAYMVPALFAVIDELPRNVSGKLRRSALPVLTTRETHRRSAMTPPRTPVERAIAQGARQVLSLPEDPSVDDDFFEDLGVSSLHAAMLVSALRVDPTTASVTVRDLYEARTIAGLARRAAPSTADTHAIPVDGSPGNPGFVTAAQTAWLLGGLLIASPLAYLVVFRLLPWLSGRINLIPMILLAPLALMLGGLIFTPLPILTALLAKKILIGRYAPTRVPVWSGLYLRMWIVQRIVRVVPWGLIAGTEFQCMALRVLGARIGQRVHIHRGVDVLAGGWDLLEIGDDVTISQDASLRLVQLDEGHVVVGAVTLAAGATLDVRAGVGPNTHVGRKSWLSALSSLPAGASIPDGEMWNGVPAHRVESAPVRPPVTEKGKIFSPVVHGLITIVIHSLVWSALTLPVTLASVALAFYFDLTYDSLLAALGHPTAHLPLLSTGVLSLCLALVCMVGLEAVAARALGTVREGVISRWSVGYIRVWLKTGLVNSAGTWLSGGLFWPVWLRWSGMKIARGCEISTIIDVVPELIQIGRDSFLADGIYLGGPRIQHGTVTTASAHLGNNTFLGNHAVVAGGQKLPEDILIGICTVVDDRVVRTGSSWFGHPPFELPHREIVKCDPALTHKPSMVRIVNRLFWEWLRFALPIIPVLVLAVWVRAVFSVESVMPFGVFLVIGTPAIALGCALLPCLFVLALKWFLLGRVRAGTHPLWSCWCSRWDFLYVAWGFLAGGTLAVLEGTLLLPLYLRRMGMKIGKRAVLGGGFAQVVDPDMITIGDGATVHAMFQAHTFEDRVLKIGHIRVGDYSTLAGGTVPLYGADIGRHTYVAPHSVVMKHEHLQAGLRYEGAPIRTQEERTVRAEVPALQHDG